MRIFLTTQPRALKPTAAEQRLEANRCYYEFATDRAILTDVVIHTVNPQPPIPVIIRAKKVRQLAEGEFSAEKVQISTSSFARPTFGVGADRIYVREDLGEGKTDGRVEYDARDATLRVFDTPVFYWPHLSGVADNNEGILRNIGLGHQTGLGTGGAAGPGAVPDAGAAAAARTWTPSTRSATSPTAAPSPGWTRNYLGGFVTDTTKQASNFEGQFKSFFVYDQGSDDIGRPLPVNPDEHYRLRGYAQFEHQHFFPDGWQFQFRGNWVSDQEFLEQYYPRRFDDRPAARRVGLPQAPGGRRGADPAVPVPAQPPGHQQRLLPEPVRGRAHPRDRLPPARRQPRRRQAHLLQREHVRRAALPAHPRLARARKASSTGSRPASPRWARPAPPTRSSTAATSARSWTTR